MAGHFDPFFSGFHATPAQLPQSDLRNNDAFTSLPGTYHDFDSNGIGGGWIPVAPPTDSVQSPGLASRLAGEPAFCAGRHCCQWSVNNYTCNYHYPSAEDLDRHVAADHAGKSPGGQPSGDYHCHWAGCSKTESFGNKPKLTRHIHSHTGHKPHQCKHPGCGRGFVTKEQLKNHETTHTRTKEHVCPECGKGFAVKTALTSHMNVHKGAKPYICDECGKGFADSSNLSKHKAIHKRAALKKSHSRRQSACHTCSGPSASPSMPPPGTALHSPYLRDFATPSIEPQEYCGLPCFDSHCSEQERLPCRSASPCKTAPCSNRECSPGCIEPCDMQQCPEDLCDLDHCFPDPCALQQCMHPQPCDLSGCNVPDCGLPDCTQDCTQFCDDDHHFDCFCQFDDETTTLSTPSTQPSVPLLPQSHNHGKAHMHSHHNSAPAGDFQLDHSLSEGFKQLNDFIHGVNCGCVGQDKPCS